MLVYWEDRFLVCFPQKDRRYGPFFLACFASFLRHTINHSFLFITVTDDTLVTRQSWCLPALRVALRDREWFPDSRVFYVYFYT